MRPNPITVFVIAVAFISLASAADRAHRVAVSDSIPADASRDVTDAFNALFASVAPDTTVVFPENARYRIDGTVVIDDKHRLTIEGNGALLRAVDPGGDFAKSEDYQNWRRVRNRAHVRIAGGSDIVVKNLEVHGAHPNPGKAGDYDADREAQHGFDVVGATDAVLQGVVVHDVYGDCVYISKCRRVTVRGSTLTRCGRQGIAVATGWGVLIEDNTIADSRRGIIDIEPYGKGWETGNITIIGNRLGGSRLLLLPMGGGGTIGAVFIADNVNTEHNGTPAVYNKGKPEQGRGPFVMVNNRFTIGGSSAPGLKILANDGVLIAGNVLTYPESRKMTAVDLAGSTGVVAGNAFSGADAVASDDGEVKRFANTVGEDAKPAKTHWEAVPGGYAVRIDTPDGTIIALVRAGLDTIEKPKPIRAFGMSTDGDFAWVRIVDGKAVEGGSRGGASYRYDPDA